MQFFKTSACFAIFVLVAACYGEDQPPVSNAPTGAAKPGASESSAPKEEPSAAAVTVFIDAATKKVRQPKPAELENLHRGPAPANSTGSENANIIYGAHGAVGVKLPPESRNYVVFSKKSDGKLSMECVTGAEAATQKVADSGADPSESSQ